MISRARVAVVLLSASIFAGTRSGVTFHRLYERDPCDDRTIVFTTTVDRDRNVSHAFRLGCTDTLFVAREPDLSPFWTGPVSCRLDLFAELWFFGRQMEMLTETLLERVLAYGRIRLIYYFDTFVKEYMFFFFVADKMLTSCVNGKVQYYDALAHLGHDAVELVKERGSGRGIDFLRRYASYLYHKWHGFCVCLRSVEDNSTDVYDLRYHPSAGTVSCSLMSQNPWRHLVYFGQLVTQHIDRTYINWTGMYLTVGTRRPLIGSPIRCNISFPSGMIASQTISPFDPATRVTTADPDRPDARDRETALTPEVGITLVVAAIAIGLLAALVIGLLALRRRPAVPRRNVLWANGSMPVGF